MPVAAHEDLFRFVHPRDYDEDRGRLNSSLFYTRGYMVSVNLGSIWDLAKHLDLLQNLVPDYGLCSLTAGQVYELPIAERPAVDILPDPLDCDPLLGIPNPAHHSLSRELNGGEARRAAKAASENMHHRPGSPH